MRVFTAALGVTLAMAPVFVAAAHADLAGSTVTVTEYAPDLSTVASGPVGPKPVNPVATFGCCILPENGTLTVTGTQIIYTANAAETYDSGAFVGFKLDFTGAPPILSAILDPASQIDPVITFSVNEILLNASGLTSPAAGAKEIIDVTVPEPSSAPLVGFGLLASGFFCFGFARHRAT